MIRIVQCLCPARHAIMAIAYDTEGLEAVPEEHITGALRDVVKEAIATNKINPWCGICSSTEANWFYENAPSRFRTMDEARPVLEQQAEACRRTREHFASFGQGARN